MGLGLLRHPVGLEVVQELREEAADWFAPATAELSNSAWPLVQRDLDALEESQGNQSPKVSYEARCFHRLAGVRIRILAQCAGKKLACSSR